MSVGVDSDPTHAPSHAHFVEVTVETGLKTLNLSEALIVDRVAAEDATGWTR